jgi:hypothetical protein
MSLYGIAGLTGEGKTYVMTRLGIKELERSKPDVQLYACYHINYPELQDRIHFFDSTKEFLSMENAIVLIDEASIWFNSRNWNSLDPKVQYKILQHRKDGLKIFATAQFWDGVDKYVRQNAHRYYEVKKIIGSDETQENVWGLVRLRQYPPRLYDKIRRPVLSTEYFMIRKKYVEYYNTFEKVTPNSNAKNKKEDREAREETKELQKKIEKETFLQVKRSRGRPRKLKIY